MRRALTPHPQSLPSPVSRIAVQAVRPRPGALALSFEAVGDMAGLSLPPAGAPARTDELWRSTCFEAFVRGPDGEAYVELNFAPSRQWAAYRLEGYRKGLQPAPIPDPRIEVEAAADALRLQALVELDALAELAADAPWRLGLSAVIAAADGRIGYWALAHPPGRPDFHHADCFALELVAPGRP